MIVKGVNLLNTHMIDTDLILSERFQPDCESLFAAHTGDCTTHVGNFPAPEWDDSLHQAEDFFIKRHSNSHHKQQMETDHAVLDRFYVTDPKHSIYKWFQAKTGLETLRVVSNLQRPGTFTPWHYDRNTTFLTKTEAVKDLDVTLDDLEHYFYFHTDQEPGQFFLLGSEHVQWRAGDMIQTAWWMPHATANSSYSDRKVTSIVGFRA